MARSLAVLAAGFAVGAPPATGEAQESNGPEPPGPGHLLEELASVSDSSQRYALLLPPSYDGASARPLLLVLDPRGRAVPALRRFRSAARLGWLVMSSYETRSDIGDPSVNERAVDAMLADAQELLAVDTDRVYLAGFSGTARLGWAFAGALAPHVAGLVGVGAGMPGTLAASLTAHAAALPDHFAFWGGSGRLDFNYEEVRALEPLLDRLGVDHRRIVHYPGRHAWLPEAQAADAVAWFELIAMREGLTATRRAWVDSLMASRSDRARRSAASGDTVEALRGWRSIARDFEGLVSVDAARERAAALAGSEAVARHASLRERQRAEHAAFEDRFWPVVERMKTAVPPPPHDRVTRELGLATLRDRWRGDDPADALQAGRLLALVFTQMSFYVPREALRRSEPDRALAAIEVAEVARPGTVRASWFRARAHAQAGRVDEAFEALARLRERGGVPGEALARDRWLAPLRTDARWNDVVRSDGVGVER